MTERALVRYGTTEIAYQLRRTGRQKTVSIAVDPEEGVLVTAPQRAARERVDAIVRAKGRWIVDRLRVASRAVPNAAKSFVSGETFFYLGRQYRLRVETGDTPGVRLVRGRLVVVVERGLDEAARATEVRASLVRWYRDHARVRLQNS